MDKRKRKRTIAEKPVEHHDTAAWANIDRLKPNSKVFIPSEEEVMNAKEWVDENEK